MARFLRLVLYFIISSIIILIISNIYYNMNKVISLETAISSLIAMCLTIYIAITQDQQLEKLKNIGNQTRETTEKLETNSIITERVSKFFNLKNKGEKYKLFFPVEYKRRPLPLINQGDFYAIHVLSTRLENNLELQQIVIDDNLDIPTVGNEIHICAPHANPALKRIFGVRRMNKREDIDNEDNMKWLNDDLGLPCWFIEYEVDNLDAKRFCWDEVPGNDNGKFKEFLNQNFNVEWKESQPIKKDNNEISVWTGDKMIFLELNDIKTKVDLKINNGKPVELIAKNENGVINIYAKGKWVQREIWVHYDSFNELLVSPAENSYIKSYFEDGRETKNQRDYGIFARITKNNKQYIIIAGIHQYGTWIVTSLLSDLLSGKEVSSKDIFLSENDFMAIIWGLFDYQKMTVDSGNRGIHQNFIWTKIDGEWKKGK